MKKITFLFLFILSFACKKKLPSTSYDLDSIFAWCIVPFDSLKRTPEQRIDMLKNLGIKKYAYDWRNEHLPQMAKELKLAKENNIEVISVWMWLDDDWDAVGTLNPSNNKVLSVIEEVGYTGQIWISFNANFFDGLTDAEAVDKGAKIISYIHQKAKALHCKIGLYNHGDWFGDPRNQIKIINAIPNADIGLIYNFHHSHNQLEIFPELTTAMMPYLWSVNLNGIRKEGPKILAIGKGDSEEKMIELLIKEGYKGDFGILGHIENADVEQVLKANLEGLDSFERFNLKPNNPKL